MPDASERRCCLIRTEKQTDPTVARISRRYGAVLPGAIRNLILEEPMNVTVDELRSYYDALSGMNGL